MTKCYLQLVACMLTFAFVGTGYAIQFESSRAALAADDFINWSQLGTTLTFPAQPAAVVSNLGIHVDVTNPLSSEFGRVDQSFSWDGNFAPGDALLWTADESLTSITKIRLEFDGSGISRGGTQIQPNSYVSFTARIEAFDASTASLGFFDAIGTSSDSADNSALFIGVSDPTIAIHAIEVSIIAVESGVNIGSYAINRFDFTSIPEPSTLALFVMGCAAMGYRCRQR